MLALPDPNGQAEVSRPSTGVIPSSIGHEENTTEDSTDSGRSGVPIDYDLARVPSVELPPLPSVTAFNRDLDIEHSQGIMTFPYGWKTCLTSTKISTKKYPKAIYQSQTVPEIRVMKVCQP